MNFSENTVYESVVFKKSILLDFFCMWECVGYFKLIWANVADPTAYTLGIEVIKILYMQSTASLNLLNSVLISQEQKLQRCL